MIVVSDGAGWDHVSVSLEKRCPTWAEMCKVKKAFFEKTEEAFQLHPLESDYVNFHPYCLHLWRNQSGMELPDSLLVGPKTKD